MLNLPIDFFPNNRNPTSNLIQIKCNSSIQNCKQAILINSTGQIVNTWMRPEVNQDQVSLKISNLATGLYQVVLITNTQTYTGKVVIQNKLNLNVSF